MSIADKSSQLEPEAAPIEPTYRAISVLGVASIAFGVASLLLFFDWMFIVLPLAGLTLGWWGFQRVVARGDDMTGAHLAMAGMLLSCVFGLIGGGLNYMIGRSEIPAGHKLITFDELQPNLADPNRALPESVDKLEGELVYLQGYIYPGRQIYGLRQFVFVPSQSHCSFCSRQLKSTEMMSVEMAGDRTAEYTTRRMGVGGRLRIDREAAKVPYGTFPYRLECDYVK